MKVLSSIYDALTYVLLSVKINCVLMRGTNETEIGKRQKVRKIEIERDRKRRDREGRERERQTDRQRERERERERWGRESEREADRVREYIERLR